MENIIRYLKDNDVKYNEYVDLSKITSYKVGGKARLIIYPSNEKELVKVLKIISINMANSINHSLN
jgi:UDP-N-acetylenolpyruvoylglucosamine reductase